jgi:hypothetical protein
MSIFAEYFAKLQKLFLHFIGRPDNVTLLQTTKPLPMSKIRQPSGDDYPEAAAKHLADAKSLLGANRTDGAAYISGYVVECALKSLVLVESGNARAFGHQLTNLSQHVLHLAAQAGARTARYKPKINPSPSICDGRPNGWYETLRYREVGAVTATTAAAWVGEAEAIFTSTVVPMRIDGLV